MNAFVAVGTEVAHYRIESLIGRGGMAFVYRAEDLRLGRRVALKILAPELSQSEDFRKRFLRESRFAAGLEHPNIIPIYEAGETDGLLYLAMRYCPEGDLEALLAKKGRLELTEAVAIVARVAAALDAAHAVGLVHRDVKPANILIGSRGDPGHPPHIYLSDFGLIKRPSSLSAVTATGHFLGTANFAAPEQIRGEPAHPRTDLYALGCVLYQCLTGAAPFVREDQAALLWAHLTQAPPPLADFQADLAPIDPILAKALAKSPDDRYDSCGEFAIALGQALTGAPSGQAREWVVPPARAAATVDTAAAQSGAGGAGAGGAAAGAAPPESTAPPEVLPGPPTLPPPRPPLDQRAPNDQRPPGAANRADPGRPSPVARLADRGHHGTRPRGALILIPVAAAAVLTLLGILAVHTLRSAGTPASAPTAAAPASAPAASTCTAAIDSANRSLDQGQQIEAAFKEHSNVMHQQDLGQLTAQQAFDMGRPALTRGAAASAQFDQVLTSYQQLAADCRASPASANPCKPSLAAADQALSHAQQLEAALREHTDVMNQLDYGKISVAQASHLGMASLDKGQTESTQFDQAVAAYRPLAGSCR